MAAVYQKIRVEDDGRLRIVSFNDPDRLNAMDVVMVTEFAGAMRNALDDPDVRAILLTGEGRSFCSGANLKDVAIEHARGGVTNVDIHLRRFINPLLVAMAETAKPIVATVNGPAVGVGCGLALAADIVLIGASGYFLQSFVRLGVVPDGGSSWIIPRLAGRGRATAMMMLGEKVDARQAVEWGLAWRLVADEDLARIGRETARQLASGPTLAYGRIKEMLRASETSRLADQIELEAMSQSESFATIDCREGIAAFVEKRAPIFLGR